MLRTCFLVSAPTPESSTKESEVAIDTKDEKTVSAPDVSATARLSQDRTGLSESAIGQAGMADVVMGQKASFIPGEGDDINRSTPIANEAVERALEQATIPSKDDVAPSQTEVQETDKEPPGNSRVQIRGDNYNVQ